MFTKRQGMTLIEIIVAASISLVVVGMLAFQQSTSRRAEKRIDDRQTYADLQARLERQLKRDLRSAVGYLSEEANSHRLTILYLHSEVSAPAYKDVTYKVSGKGVVTREEEAQRKSYDFSKVSKDFLFTINEQGEYQIGQAKGKVHIPNDFGSMKPGTAMWNDVDPIPMPNIEN